MQETVDVSDEESTQELTMDMLTEVVLVALPMAVVVTVKLLAPP